MRELLDMREHAWAQRLRAVSLVAEIEAKPRHTEQALDALGRRYAAAQRGAHDTGQVLRRWPAVHLMTTVYAATERYDHGNFWTGLFDLAGVEQTQYTQNQWGRLFLENLERFDLPTFPEIQGTAFVSRILMHSGVPTFCLTDLFQLISERQRIDGPLSADEFVAWAERQVRRERMHQWVYKPVRRFLRFGEDYAVDVVDRMMQLTDRVVATGEAGEDHALPDRFARRAVELHREGMLVGTPSKRREDAETSASPHLVLDPYGRGLLLRLPPVATIHDGAAAWQVSIAGDTRWVHTRAEWPGEPAPGADVPIPQPVRQVSASLSERPELETAVHVVDDEQPLLVFREDGSDLISSSALPADVVWVVLPGAAEDLKADGSLLVVAHGVLPPGWAGWSAALVDLREVRSLSVMVNGKETRRYVRRVRRVRLAIPPAVAGVRTRAGAPVYAELPRVELPPDDTVIDWRLTVTDESGSEIWATDLAPGSESQAWDGLAEPLVGLHHIRVRGPWGRGSHVDLVLAEGLRVDSAPGWRQMAPGGLAPATLTATAPVGWTERLGADLLRADALSTTLRLTRDASDVALVVEPPHMSVSHQGRSGATPAAVTPLALTTEDLVDDPGVLTIDLGTEGAPTLHHLARGESRQEIAPHGGARGGVYRFDLQRMTGTLRAIPQGRLCLDPEGRVTVAEIRPRQLHGAVRVDGPQLVFEECADVEGLTAVVYAEHAPWRQGTALPIQNGVADLLNWMVQAGPLLVHTKVDDPWLPTPVPPWVRGLHHHRVLSDGCLSSDDDEESELSEFLAGLGDCPSPVRDLSRLWAALTWAAVPRPDLSGPAVRRIIGGIAQELQAQPREALQALGESPIDDAESPAALIRSGLAWQSFARAAPERRWTRHSHLSLLLGTSLRAPSAETIDGVEGVVGPIVSDLLRGVDPAQGAGRVDEAADRLLHLPEAHRAEFLRAAGLVPAGLLSADTRASHVLHLMEMRKHPRLAPVCDRTRDIVGGADHLFTRLGHRAALDSVRSLVHPASKWWWRGVPALSLALAFGARIAAREDGDTPYETPARTWVHTHAPLWVDLALVLPELVETHLTLAELLLTAAETETQGD